MLVWSIKDLIQFPLADHLDQPLNLYILSLKQILIMAAATKIHQNNNGYSPCIQWYT